MNLENLENDDKCCARVTEQFLDSALEDSTSADGNRWGRQN